MKLIMSCVEIYNGLCKITKEICFFNHGVKKCPLLNQKKWFDARFKTYQKEADK